MNRLLRQEEINIITYLLKNRKDEKLLVTIPNSVVDMDDGGMGSVRFISDNEQKFGREYINAKYIDEDDIEVFITINLDAEDKIFELDFWKVDFNRLIRYPKPEQLIIL